MSLRDRLRRLDRRRSPRGRRDAGLARASREESGSCAPAPEAIEESRVGAVRIRTTRFRLDDRHGSTALREVLDADPRRLGAAGRVGGPVDVRECVFLDTETSDLGGGTSTYVFLTGALFIEDGRAVVEQILLEGPEDEGVYLERVHDRLAGRRHLVTFSGKSFDRHRLDDRFELLAGERPLRDRTHLDLYHPLRRLYQGRTRDTRLQTLERELLGVVRVDDLPGAECPDAWFDFLEGFDDGRMERVLEHNLVDVLSLVGLTACLDRALAAPRDAIEAARSGLLLLGAGDAARAEPWLQQAVDSLVDRRYRVDRDVRRAVMEYARLLRRRGDPGGAVCALERLSRSDPSDPQVEVELAKIAEHDRKDPAAALSHAREARARLLGRAGRAGELDDVMRRIRRIERRLRRT